MHVVHCPHCNNILLKDAELIGESFICKIRCLKCSKIVPVSIHKKINIVVDNHVQGANPPLLRNIG